MEGVEPTVRETRIDEQIGRVPASGAGCRREDRQNPAFVDIEAGAAEVIDEIAEPHRATNGDPRQRRLQRTVLWIDKQPQDVDFAPLERCRDFNPGDDLRPAAFGELQRGFPRRDQPSAGVVVGQRDRFQFRPGREGDDLRRGEVAVAGRAVQVQIGGNGAIRLRDLLTELGEGVPVRHQAPTLSGAAGAGRSLAIRSRMPFTKAGESFEP